ncbi:hypothetical protein K402DRAFT_421368 [Aulographum hederae CBS 113979]|uniref:Aminoglycoside phosphotransferase domain-containing protein n=1 Tax=Aulographum hederae CBS 113979 TaxID=1176131 RepID=A0A6G1GZH0_9PEZI|nr:hypothetical protein K402DRAFT_421368 [Aulographum hederae CBS 113979]
MEKLPGATYIEACLQHNVYEAFSPEQYPRQSNTVTDFAKFLAASWKSPQDIDTESTKAKFIERFNMLARELLSRFTPRIHEISNSLDIVFTADYPSVLTHGDLCEMNFLVDPQSGHLTGVIDWAEAEILPFGCALWGLKNLLGFMDGAGWSWLALFPRP